MRVNPNMIRTRNRMYILFGSFSDTDTPLAFLTASSYPSRVLEIRVDRKYLLSLDTEQSRIAIVKRSKQYERLS